MGPLVPSVLDLGGVAHAWVSKSGQIRGCLHSFVTCAQWSPESSLVAGKGHQTWYCSPLRWTRYHWASPTQHNLILCTLRHHFIGFLVFSVYHTKRKRCQAMSLFDRVPHPFERKANKTSLSHSLSCSVVGPQVCEGFSSAISCFTR